MPGYTLPKMIESIWGHLWRLSAGKKSTLISMNAVGHKPSRLTQTTLCNN